MAKVLNLDNIPKEYVDDPNFESKMKTISLGAAAGSERIYVNVDFVKPGAKSVKYHAHSRQEEFFLILAGEGVLRMDDKEIPVKKGDFVAKTAGRGIAHQFINTGTEILEILDCGLTEADDVITYPEEGVVFCKKQGFVFKRSDALEHWSSDPNK
ncbi:MAG: mannose-6-phosphate isomerase [candidate division Zixibacteria bacterium SM23_73]|nr:MAG: mannose-6-phosphate isomerase [candidate division Zixibacteria bacterium SM23_73]